MKSKSKTMLYSLGCIMAILLIVSPEIVGVVGIKLSITANAVESGVYQGYQMYKDETTANEDPVFMCEAPAGKPKVTGWWKTKTAVKKQIDKALAPPTTSNPDPTVTQDPTSLPSEPTVTPPANEPPSVIVDQVVVIILTESGGSVTPTYYGNVGDTILISANPSEGYEFSHWRKHNEPTTKPQSFTWTADTDMAWKAMFELSDPTDPPVGESGVIDPQIAIDHQNRVMGVQGAGTLMMLGCIYGLYVNEDLKGIIPSSS